MKRGWIAALVLVLTALPALAADWSLPAYKAPPEITFRKDSILVFGGLYRSGNMGQALSPFGNYDSAGVIGAAYRREFYDIGLGIKFGAEAGLAGRFGDGNSAEIWGGATFRRAFVVANVVTISPGIVMGLSATSSAMGVERLREIQHGGDSTLLFYFSPELAFSFASIPNVDFVFRLHHRSGLKGTLGHMHEGHNASTFGVRWYFN